jgi:hypothetical protein
MSDIQTTVPAMSQADAAKLANVHSGTINLGPLTINWNLDLSIPRFIADATLHGISLGHVVLDTSNPNAKIGGNIGIADAEVDLTADFTKKQVDYHAIVSIFGHKLIDKSGVLATW